LGNFKFQFYLLLDASNFVSFINEHNQTGIEESLIGKVVNPTHRPAGLFDEANFVLL